MKTNPMIKQMLDYQKTTFDKLFNAMVLVQEQGEKMTNALFEQVTWLPEENKRLMDQCLTMAKQGRDDLKSAVDDNYKNVSDLLASK